MTQDQTTQFTSRLTLHCAIALVVAMTVAIPKPVNAGDQTPTAEEKEACMDDVFRLCSSHIPDRSAITACLRSKQASLSQQCRYVISARDTGHKSSNSR
ncbi:Putative Type III effector, NopAO [Bradyrhizobium vignae]|uniref:Type III effector, NopAO n=1 Tax=Bradyrhizobium vignae TaxID=1549949 RepID=A0A2U3Q975_9BRAD|nr:Putative Type III effector, NopAO [Bradyrhizobium vignae]